MEMTKRKLKLFNQLAEELPQLIPDIKAHLYFELECISEEYILFDNLRRKTLRKQLLISLLGNIIKKWYDFKPWCDYRTNKHHNVIK